VRATVIGLAVLASAAASQNLAGQSAQASTPAPAAVSGRADSARQDSLSGGTLAFGRDSISFGSRTIPAGSTVAGPVVVAGGDLTIRGTISGSAVALGSDVIISPGGRVTGDAVAVLGTVRLEGGQLGGRARSIGGVQSPFTWGESTGPVEKSTAAALKLSVGWMIVLLLIGIGVLVFAGSYLDGVVDVLEQSFWRSLVVGVVGELALFPAMLLLIVGLAVTVIGILLIPFAAVAFVLAALGLLTLGFLSVARLTGHSITSPAAGRLSASGSALRALMIGVVAYLLLWIIAAAFTWAPVPSAVIRALAMVVTWVAVTAGFGAAILSRAGTRRDVSAPAPAASVDQIGWQTPTPVTGVAAARRPSVASKHRAS
jgi:hypothetical protein